MTVHSPIGASSMYRWSACPGSVRLSKGIPPTTSKYAEEGTRAHEIAAKVLANACRWATPLLENIDEETYEAVNVYVDTILSDLKPSVGNLEFLIEHKFDLSEIYPGLYGTADAVHFDGRTKLLRVYDYKHGAGVVVEVENNIQLKYYGLGALLSCKYPAHEIELVIVQPRANHPDGPVRRFRFKTFELIDFAADLEMYAKATADPSAPLVPGDHCRFCPAAGICPALKNKALALAQIEFKPELSYNPQELSETLRKVDMIEDYAKSVRAFAYSEAEHGRCPPGWKLVNKRASRQWKNITDAGDIFAKQDECWTQPELKSVAQVEKVVGKKAIEGLAVSVSSGLTLVEESDPRQAVNAGAINEFAKIESKETNENLSLYD